MPPSRRTWRLGRMVFREVSVIEIREVLRSWLAGAGLRTVAAQAGVDRKAARRYVEAAVAAGLARDGGPGQLTDGLVGQVAQVVRPVRPGGHGRGWERLEACRAQIEGWVKQGLTVVKIGVLLERGGVVVPYRTLHRFCAERCGYGRTAATTVRVADGEPGAECQLDFGYLGLLFDPVSGRHRKVHALIFTACYSRHMFVWLSFTQTLAAFIAGCEAAWVFFGGVFKVLIPDNASAIVGGADAVNPRFTAGWLDYAQHCGFATDAARVRSPKDKTWASYCTSWCCCGVNSPGELAALAFDQPWIARWGRVEERDVLVVGLAGGEQPGAAPGLDRGDVDAEAAGDLGEGEQAAGAEPVGVAGQVVAAAQVEHDPAGEWLAFAGAVRGGVERGGCLGVGVVVKQPVERGDDRGIGLPGLPGRRRDRDGKAGDLAAAEPDVQVDAVGLDHGDVVDEQPGHALALALRGGRVGPQGGEVGGQRPDAGLVGGGERGGGRGGVVVVVLGGLQGAQRGVPVGFQVPATSRLPGSTAR